MNVSPESNARYMAFRQLVYHCSQELTYTELHAVVYIWLYNERDTYKEAAAIEVLSKLESTGLFSPWSPEGLLELLKAVKRQDLYSDVKDFMRTKWPKVVKKVAKKSLCEKDEDLQATFEVVVAQTTVLMQQIEAFEKVLLLEQRARERARDILTNAAQTAKSLADRLQRAHDDLYKDDQVTDNDQYVDLDSFLGKRATHIATSSKELTSEPLYQDISTTTVSTSIAPPPTAPEESEDIGEYVDMSTAVHSTLKHSGNTKQDSITDLTSCYSDSVSLASCYSLPAKKSPVVVGPSTVMATLQDVSTLRNMAHSSSSDSSPPVSTDSSPARHSSSDAEMAKSPHSLPEGVMYCNIKELQAKLNIHTPDSSETEAIYSNLRPDTQESDIVLPPRDIQRIHTANLTTSLPKLPERQYMVREGTERGSEQESKSSGEGELVSSGTVRPNVAPKPRLRQKPDIPPRRSSLSRTSLLNVRAQVAPRSQKCISVVSFTKVSTNQNEAGSTLLSNKTKEEPLETGDSQYYTQLHPREPQGQSMAVDSDRGYAIVHHNS